MNKNSNMMRIEQLGNVLVAEVLNYKVIVNAFQQSITVTIVKDDKEVSVKEISAFSDELLETAHETVLEDILNNVFSDIEEGTDELLGALESEIEEYLLKAVQDGAGSQKQLN